LARASRLAAAGTPLPDRGGTRTQNAARPAAVEGHALLHDSSRRQAVLIAGQGVGNVPLRAAWLWHNNSWARGFAYEPDAIVSPAVALDAGRGAIVIHGGWDSAGTPRAETWERMGNRWLNHGTGGPGIRTAHAAVYDAARRRTIVYGGNGAAGPTEETWSWNGRQWTRLHATGPGPRLHPAMAYDAARGVVILFGGAAPGTPPAPVGDTWALDGSGWKRVATSGPSPRILHAMAYDVLRQRVVLYGGATAEFRELADTWEWDGVRWSLRHDGATAALPPRLRGHAMAFDGPAGETLLYGGFDGQALRDELWSWNGSRWRKRQ
jgi:hypothetical protein